MNKENIPVITDREELYDKCENMEQLYDKYYLPLLDVHYRKTYELQQENQQLKDEIEEYKNPIKYFKYANKNVIDENQQLKIQVSSREEVCNRLESNWNKLKEYLNYKSERAVGEDEYVYDELIDKMQELEQGSDSNE